MTRDGTDRLPYHQWTVRPEWIDYNGHLSEAFYVLVFGHATDLMMAGTGLDSGYREETGCSLYTVEAHLRYLREVPEGAELTVRTRVLGTAARKLHFCHEMYLGSRPDDDPVATAELLALHVDQRTGRAVPFPHGVRQRYAPLVEPAPDWAGRSIAALPPGSADPGSTGLDRPRDHEGAGTGDAGTGDAGGTRAAGPDDAGGAGRTVGAGHTGGAGTPPPAPPNEPCQWDGPDEPDELG